MDVVNFLLLLMMPMEALGQTASVYTCDNAIDIMSPGRCMSSLLEIVLEEHHKEELISQALNLQMCLQWLVRHSMRNYTMHVIRPFPTIGSITLKACLL